MAGTSGPGAFSGGLYDPGTAVGQQDAQDAAATILPHTQVFTAPNSQLANFQTPVTSAGSSPGVVDSFLSKVGSIFSETAGIVDDIGKAIGKSAVIAVEAPVKLGIATYQFSKDEYDYYNLNNQRSSLDSQQQNLMNSYKSGKINNTQYTAGMKQLNQDMANWSKAYEASFEKIDHDSKAGVSADVNTEGDILTLLTAGTINPAEVTGADAGTSAAIRFMTGEGSSTAAFLTKSASAIDNVMSKIPGISGEGFTNSLSRQFLKDTTDTITDAAGGQGLSAMQIGKSAVTAVVLRRPLVFNYLVGQGKEVYDELSDQKYGDAISKIAINTSMALSGGPIGWAFEHAGSLLHGAIEHTFGQTSFLDELSQKIGNGSANGLYDVLSKPENEDMAKAFKAMEATNLQATNGDVTAAVARITDAYDGANMQVLQEMDHQSVAKDMYNTYTDQQAVVADLKRQGLSDQDAARAVVGRWTVADNGKLQGMLIKADQGVDTANFEDHGYTTLLDARAAARRGVIQALQTAKGRNSAWLNNDFLQGQIDKIITTKEDTGEMAQAIRDIDTGVAQNVSPRVAKELAQHGHVAILPEDNKVPYIAYEDLKEGQNKLVSKFASGERSSVFEKASQPLPVLGSVGSLLTRVGLSPVDAGSTVMRTFNENLTEQLQDTAVGRMGASGEDLLKSLANYVKNPTATFLKVHNIPVTDYRQMTLNDIKTALGVGTNDAREVRSALMTSMLKVPLEIRGLGDRVMDLNYKINPLAKYYSRIQGATRYVFNPFFNWQKATQTEFLAQFEAGGKTLTYGPIGGLLRMLMPQRYQDIDSTINMLDSKNILGSSRSDALSIGRLGEGDYDQSVGKVGTKLLKGEQQSLASLVMVMADKVGLSPEEFVDAHYNETVDALRTIVQYGQHNSALNSPLARTLNFAFFPMRYNLKVVGLMAKYVQQLSAPMQVVFLHSMMQMDSFLKSDEGMAWYAQHADVIQLFQYISPLYSLDYLNQIFNNPGSISSYGTLGGLPFGFITQGLDAAGLTHFNSAYVSSKDGETVPSYVPVNTRGQINVAIQDLLGQLFTYPGATAGLPSKSGILKKVGTGLTGGNSSDLQAETGTLSPQQQRYQRVVQQSTGNAPAMPNGQQFTKFDGPSINSINIPVTTSATSEESVTPPKATKKTKAEFTPELLPGQSSLGQIP